MNKPDPSALERERLDYDFDLRARSPGFDVLLGQWAEKAAAFRLDAKVMTDLAYGSHALEKLDLFLPREAGAPCCIFFHPGSWQRLDKSLFSFLAEPFLAGGCAVAIANYPLIPEVGMDDIVASARACVQWVIQAGSPLGLDIARIGILGHSAGGHLATMLYSSAGMFAPQERSSIRAVASVGGFYDLDAVRNSFMNDSIGLTREAAARNSPLYRDDLLDCPLILSVGTNETGEFLRQYAGMQAAMHDQGRTVQAISLPGLDHFSVVLALAQPANPVSTAVLSCLR